MNISRLGVAYQLSDKYKVYFYLALIFICSSAGACIEGDAGIGVIVGGLAGVLGHWKTTWVSQLNVAREQVDTLEQLIELMGYRNAPSPGHSESIWIPGTHRPLRFDAQNVIIKKEEAAYTVIGPFYVLKRVKNGIDGLDL